MYQLEMKYKKFQLLKFVSWLGLSNQRFQSSDKRLTNNLIIIVCKKTCLTFLHVNTCKCTCMYMSIFFMLLFTMVNSPLLTFINILYFSKFTLVYSYIVNT